MKDLIKEIEKKKSNIDGFAISDYADGYLECVDEILELLTQHNIIVTPKSINLSEIVSRLNLAFPRIVRERKKVIRIYNKKASILNIINDKLQPVNIQPYSETKWLYALWIAGTEIVDDMEEE